LFDAEEFWKWRKRMLVFGGVLWLFEDDNVKIKSEINNCQQNVKNGHSQNG
jgi:hypothetical protein